MKKTKVKILNAALRLFNQYGIAKVTTRRIATKMKISQGNLTYHFRKRDDILENLYINLVEEIDVRMLSQEIKTPMEMLYRLSITMMETLYEYRFFMLDFAHIMRDNKTIRLHYQQLIQKRQQQYVQIFLVLHEQGLMNAQAYEGEYVNLYKRMQIIGDFWISSAEIRGEIELAHVVSSYAETLAGELYPYFTPAGRRTFEELAHAPEELVG